MKEFSGLTLTTLVLLFLHAIFIILSLYTFIFEISALPLLFCTTR